jgi:PIN domain nuclease of toxin-antitoxin system
VRLLLDTSALLWWVTLSGARISERARAAISDPDNEVYVSAASAWEISIKSGRGRLTMPQPLDRQLPSLIEKYGFGPLDISFAHAIRAGSLPDIHGDPFDRMLVAQAQLERMTLVTPNVSLGRYEVETIW